MHKTRTHILLILAIILIVVVSYSGYCKFSHSCPTIIDQIKNIWPNWTSDRETIRSKNRAIFQAKKLKYLYNSIFETKQLNGLDITREKPYTDDPEKHDQYAQLHGAQIKAGYVAPISLRFINDKVGYGAFAEAPMHAGDLIGECTGIIKDKALVTDTTYTWVYPSDKNNHGEAIEVYLDCTYGNEMRYVNHANQPNAHKIDVPVDGKWHVAYVANQDIPVGSQVTVDYGPEYWKTRNINPESFT